MPRLRKRFGQRLKGIRLARNMSQEKFTELLGISVDFLSLIERGINTSSAQLGMEVAELFTFDMVERIASSK